MGTLRASLLRSLILFALPSVVGGDTLAASQQMQAFIGTFTGSKSKGIYSASFDENTGRLGPMQLAVEARNPSYLALHPNRHWIYAVNEVSDFGDGHSGAVSGFAIDHSGGKLQMLTQEPSGGTGPCHLAVDSSGRWVLVANYAGGSVASLRIGPGGKLEGPVSVIQHSGSSLRQPRQSQPHPHFVTASPDDRYAFVCDLGFDKLFVYPLDPASGRLDKNAEAVLACTPGSGPRHLGFHPNCRFAYLVNELSSTLTFLTCNLARGALEAKQTLSMLPPGYTAENTAAEVQVHPSGKFVYASNRGRNSLAIFGVDPETGTLRFLQDLPTLGKTPRHFALEPSGRWLIAANQDSDNLVVFRVDSQTGSLTVTGDPVQVPSPACVLLVPRD